MPRVRSGAGDCTAERWGTPGVVNDARRQRLADNEARFRDLNDVAAPLFDGSPNRRYRILCECSTLACFERIEVTTREYRWARRRDDRFIIAHGHDEPEVER